MDIYDPGLMGAAGRVDGTSTPTGTISNDGPKTELDQNVEKLVGNISNWWSGFAKKSQDSINQARKEVETRGGIVNYAKREYAKLESSIGEAQKKTRDQSQTPSQPQETSEEGEIGAATKVSESEEVPVRSETSKGKQRVVDDQVAPSSAEAGTVTNQGPTLGASVSSLFSKLTSDPRIAQLQQSLTDTLQTVATPQGQPLDKEGGDAEKKSGANLINIQESLSKLSFTIQSHLPHLDLKESQQLATRYLRATESFAREVQSDMKDFVGELVQIVPPEGEGAEKREVQASKAIDAEAKIVEAVDETPSATIAATKSAPKSSAAAKAGPTTTSATTVPSEDEEDFAWDEDDEEAAASVETKAVAAKEKEAIPAASTVAATDKDAKSVESKKEETDEDSDWE